MASGMKLTPLEEYDFIEHKKGCVISEISREGQCDLANIKWIWISLLHKLA